MGLFARLRKWVFGEPEPKPTRKPSRSRARKPPPPTIPIETLQLPKGWQIEGFMPGNDGTSNMQWPDFVPYDADTHRDQWPDFLQHSSARVIVSRTDAKGDKEFGTIHGPIPNYDFVVTVIQRQPDATVSPK